MLVTCIKTVTDENEHPFQKGVDYDIDQPNAERLIKLGYLKAKAVNIKALEDAIKESIKK